MSQARGRRAAPGERGVAAVPVPAAAVNGQPTALIVRAFLEFESK
jgi:hypothetical protein